MPMEHFVQHWASYREAHHLERASGQATRVVTILEYFFYHMPIYLLVLVALYWGNDFMNIISCKPHIILWDWIGMN